MSPGNLPDDASDRDIERAGFRAVASNEYAALPQKDRRHGVVINLDTRGAGTHWTAAKEPRQGVLWYNDSFGARPPYGLARDTLVLYNNRQHQKFAENNCGGRAVEWLRQIKKHG